MCGFWCILSADCHYFDWSIRYIIFFDDDAVLEYAAVSHPPLDKTIDALRSISDNPWRAFENYLLEYKPAIGFPHFSWHLRDDSLEVQSVPMFDAMITAFHCDIWQFVFPYESRWDDKVCAAAACAGQ